MYRLLAATTDLSIAIPVGILSTGGVGTIIYLLNKQIRDYVQPSSRRIEVLEHKDLLCNYRLDQAVKIMREAGMPIPVDFWAIPPFLADKFEEPKRA